MVSSNSCSRLPFKAWKPWLVSSSPWPVVKATFFFLVVSFLISEDIWYSSPSARTTWGMDSISLPYWRQRPR